MMGVDAARHDVQGAIPLEIQGLLRTLRKRSRVGGPTPPPPLPDAALREVGPAEDCMARFVSAAESAGCRVWRTASERWQPGVVEILQSLAARQVVLEPQAGTALSVERAGPLCELLARAGIAVSVQRDDETLFSADAAVTGVRAAVAETGTLVCVTSAASARGTSLIPPVHVAVVGASQIVGDLFDAFDGLAELDPVPASVNFITGPSKTADIEGVLVTGVHGPGVVQIVVIDDT